MLDVRSPIKSFYPEDFRVDCEGKRAEWEGVVLVPFIDEAALLAAERLIPPKALSLAERARNRLGNVLVFTRQIGGQTRLRPWKLLPPSRLHLPYLLFSVEIIMCIFTWIDWSICLQLVQMSGYVCTCMMTWVAATYSTSMVCQQMGLQQSRTIVHLHCQLIIHHSASAIPAAWSNPHTLLCSLVSTASFRTCYPAPSARCRDIPR